MSMTAVDGHERDRWDIRQLVSRPWYLSLRSANISRCSKRNAWSVVREAATHTATSDFATWA